MKHQSCSPAVIKLQLVITHLWAEVQALCLSQQPPHTGLTGAEWQLDKAHQPAAPMITGSKRGNYSLLALAHPHSTLAG